MSISQPAQPQPARPFQPAHPSPSAQPSAARRSPGGAAYVLAAAALWGTTGTAASFAPAAASPLSIGAATMGLGGLLTLALAGRSALAVLRARDLRALLLIGALSVVVYPLAFYTAMDWAGVAVGTVVAIGSAPVVAALLDRVLHGSSLTGRWLAATAAATGGCAVLALDGRAAGGERVTAGVAAGLLSGAAYAVYASCASVAIRRGHPARATMGALFGLAACVLLPVLAATGGALLGGPRGLAVTAYLAVVPMCLAYVLFGAGLVRVRAGTATVLTLLEPAVAAVLGVAVVGERFGAAGWAGAGLVLLGLLVLTARRPHA